MFYLFIIEDAAGSVSPQGGDRPAGTAQVVDGVEHYQEQRDELEGGVGGGNRRFPAWEAVFAPVYFADDENGGEQSTADHPLLTGSGGANRAGAGSNG